MFSYGVNKCSSSAFLNKEIELQFTTLLGKSPQRTGARDLNVFTDYLKRPITLINYSLFVGMHIHASV